MCRRSIVNLLFRTCILMEKMPLSITPNILVLALYQKTWKKKILTNFPIYQIPWYLKYLWFNKSDWNLDIVQKILSKRFSLILMCMPFIFAVQRLVRNTQLYFTQEENCVKRYYWGQPVSFNFELVPAHSSALNFPSFILPDITFHNIMFHEN